MIDIYLPNFGSYTNRNALRFAMAQHVECFLIDVGLSTLSRQAWGM
jgi:hypothetical protein